MIRALLLYCCALERGRSEGGGDAASFFSSTPTLFVIKMFSTIIPVPTNKE
jgi:hypothetical protein